eukprot:gene10099-10255_t
MGSTFGQQLGNSDSRPLEEDFGYLQEYAALKQQLLNNTRKSGGAIGLYLLLTVNGAAALAAMIGTAASYTYLSWLCRDVDNVQPTDTVPIWEANKIENVLLRRAAKLKAAYQAALKPRLLVPVGLGLLIAVYNAVADEQLPLVYSGCLLLGFFSHKVALVVKLSFAEQPERPVIEKFEDELDQWGMLLLRFAHKIHTVVCARVLQRAKPTEAINQRLAYA